MTEIDFLTQRWYCFQEARLKEIQTVTAKYERNQRLAVFQRMNEDPLWEQIFDVLEAAIREVDPNNELLPENHIPVD